MEENNFQSKEILTLAIGEAVVACGVVAGFLALDMLGAVTFSYRVITGALLGAAIAVANYTIISLSVNRAV